MEAFFTSTLLVALAALLVALAEMGDKTQLATVSLEAEFCDDLV